MAFTQTPSGQYAYDPHTPKHDVKDISAGKSTNHQASDFYL